MTDYTTTASIQKDIRVDTYRASIPNPPWEVRVTHLPSGRTMTERGRGAGMLRAVRELTQAVRIGGATT